MVIIEEKRQALILHNRVQIESWALIEKNEGGLSEHCAALRDSAIIALASLEAEPSVKPTPATVYCLPPPITEADGYRLNTSWHSGAIFRDGANWMLEQAKQMQPTLVITLPDTGSKAFWHGSGKSEVFLPTTYKRWVKEAIERHCRMIHFDVEVT